MLSEHREAVLFKKFIKIQLSRNYKKKERCLSGLNSAQCSVLHLSVISIFLVLVTRDIGIPSHTRPAPCIIFAFSIL